MAASGSGSGSEGETNVLNKATIIGGSGICAATVLCYLLLTSGDTDAERTSLGDDVSRDRPQHTEGIDAGRSTREVAIPTAAFDEGHPQEGGSSAPHSAEQQAVVDPIPAGLLRFAGELSDLPVDEIRATLGSPEDINGFNALLTKMTTRHAGIEARLLEIASREKENKLRLGLYETPKGPRELAKAIRCAPGELAIKYHAGGSEPIRVVKWWPGESKQIDAVLAERDESRSMDREAIHRFLRGAR